jgi:hypothetical protein
MSSALDTTKIMCSERRCLWRGTEDQVLKAPSPFEPDVECWGCPDCKEINTMVGVCDEPGCWQETSCGTPTKDGGYRRTCGKHRPEE